MMHHLQSSQKNESQSDHLAVGSNLPHQNLESSQGVAGVFLSFRFPLSHIWPAPNGSPPTTQESLPPHPRARPSDLHFVPHARAGATCHRHSSGPGVLNVTDREPSGKRLRVGCLSGEVRRKLLFRFLWSLIHGTMNRIKPEGISASGLAIHFFQWFGGDGVKSPTSHTRMASNLLAMASNLLGMASNLI